MESEENGHQLIWPRPRCGDDGSVLTLHNARQSPVVLELVERLLQHVFWVDLLHAEQVEHHVVGQVEGAVQRISRALRSTAKGETQKPKVKCLDCDYTHLCLMLGWDYVVSVLYEI